MKLVARPFTIDQFTAWRSRSVVAYAADKVDAGAWSEAEALERAEAAFAVLLPAGADTAGHAIRGVTTQADREFVGWFWVGPASDSLPDTGWLFDVEIVAAHRGQGLGRKIMALAEEEARRLGFDRLGLHVIGGNTIARRLYEACGYTLTDLNYAKNLDA